MYFFTKLLNIFPFHIIFYVWRGALGDQIGASGDNSGIQPRRKSESSPGLWRSHRFANDLNPHYSFIKHRRRYIHV
jgi:hypothetical protein